MQRSFLESGRLAGLVYLGVVVTGIFSLAYVPGQLITMGDAAATYDAITGSQLLFRSGVAAGFACYVLFLILPFTLYGLVAPFGQVSAALMVGFAAVSVPLSMSAVVEQLAIVKLLGGEITDPAVLAAQFQEHLRAYILKIGPALIFWGLWLIPLGWLVVKSAIIPRVLGVFLILGGMGYVVNFFGPIFFDGYIGSVVDRYDTLASSIGEIGTCLWLLIMGARRV